MQGERRLETEGCPSTFLFIAVVEIISRKKRNILHKLLFADDLAVEADTKTDLQEWLVEWKEICGFGSGSRNKI